MTSTIDWHNYLPTLCSGIVYAYLVYCGMRSQMLQEFQTFYLYVVVSSLGSIANWSVIGAFGYNSWEYHYTYYAGHFVMGLSELAILYAIYRRVYRPSGAARLVPVMLGLYSTAVIVVVWANFYVAGKERFLAWIPLWIQLAVLALIWIHLLFRRRPTSIGLNWGGLLAGLTLVALLRLYHVTTAWAFTVSRANLPENWPQFIQLAEFSPWIVFALTMRRLDLSFGGSPRPLSRRSPAGTAVAGRSTSALSRWRPAALRRERP